MTSQSSHDPTQPSVESARPPQRSIALPSPVAPAHSRWRKLPLGPRSQLARYAIAAFVAAAALRLLTPARRVLTGDDQPADSSGSIQSRAIGPQADASQAGDSPAGDTDVLETAAEWSVTVLGVLAAAAFVFWLHRVCNNWTTQGKPRYSTKWAVLAWIIPPLNLWRPVGLMIDLFADRPGMRRIDGSDRTLLAVWWLSGLTGLLGRLYLWVRPPSDSGSQPSGDYALVVIYGLLAVSALAALRLVSELTARHDARIG